jgi:hypothetical protein
MLNPPQTPCAIRNTRALVPSDDQVAAGSPITRIIALRCASEQGHFARNAAGRMAVRAASPLDNPEGPGTGPQVALSGWSHVTEALCQGAPVAPKVGRLRNKWQ